MPRLSAVGISGIHVREDVKKAGTKRTFTVGADLIFSLRAQYKFS